ncbi:MAG: competence/damage-inducible protein A, partial [Thermoguttaceae bacterium]|nr:competence/damage-inducible protein A [Thermoguttaceae bacterium]
MANSNENQPNQTNQSKIVAEIVSIGDEISTGAILDTNSQYLSQSLSEVGVRVLYHSTVGDDANAMIVAIATAIRRADVVVITGGLGPTQDDLTRQTVADVLGVALEFDHSSLDHVMNFFSRRGRQMPESNKIQAYFPKGSHIIHNPNGT